MLRSTYLCTSRFKQNYGYSQSSESSCEGLWKRCSNSKIVTDWITNKAMTYFVSVVSTYCFHYSTYLLTEFTKPTIPILISLLWIQMYLVYMYLDRYYQVEKFSLFWHFTTFATPKIGTSMHISCILLVLEHFKWQKRTFKTCT